MYKIRPPTKEIIYVFIIFNNIINITTITYRLDFILKENNYVKHFWKT